MGIGITSKKRQSMREALLEDYLQGIIVGRAVRLVRVYKAEVWKFGRVWPDFGGRIRGTVAIVSRRATKASINCFGVPSGEKPGLVDVSGIHFVKPIVSDVGHVE